MNLYDLYVLHKFSTTILFNQDYFNDSMKDIFINFFNITHNKSIILIKLKNFK